MLKYFLCTMYIGASQNHLLRSHDSSIVRGDARVYVAAVTILGTLKYEGQICMRPRSIVGFVLYCTVKIVDIKVKVVR